MAESVVPECRGDGEGGEWCGGAGGGWYGVEVARAIAAKHHAPTRDILNRKTRGVKFNRTIVVTSKLMHRK